MVNRFHLQGRVLLGKIFTFGRDGNVNDARSKFLRFSRSRDFLFQVWKQSGKTPRIVHFQACLLLSVIWRFPGMFTLRCFSRAVNKILEKSFITSARGGKLTGQGIQVLVKLLLANCMLDILINWPVKERKKSDVLEINSALCARKGGKIYNKMCWADGIFQPRIVFINKSLCSDNFSREKMLAPSRPTQHVFQ